MSGTPPPPSAALYFSQQADNFREVERPNEIKIERLKAVANFWPLNGNFGRIF